ncbi:MAG: RagB/SusD family nutrient uptake outer membrane protein [Carboxylicivirga sp.]|jgi:hypothetical protein|nr:RagB/SusD family nutrient uptake outer membrane protein [Carboxylicivirga sp.]
MKLIKYILILTVFISVWGCEDLIEEPKSVLTQESFFKSEGDLRAATIGCFQPLMGNWNGLSVRSWALHMGADDMTSARGFNKQRLLEFDDFNISTSNIDNYNSWKTFFKVIACSNLVIANYEKISMDQVRRDEYAAQAYFLRAYSYFNAVRFWGKLPLMDGPVEDGGLNMERSEVEDVYELIVSDLKFAEIALANKKEWLGEPGFVTLGAVKTMLADVYLTMAGWPLKQSDKYTLASQKAKEVMALNQYDLMADYKDLFTIATKNNKEHIWNFQASNSAGYPSKFGISFAPPEDRGWHDYLAEVKFFENCPDNARKDIIFYTDFKYGMVNWKDSQLGLPCIEKYWERNKSDMRKINGDHLFPVYRYAEVLLIFAEAQNRANKGPDAACYQAINEIRKRANAGVADDALTGLNEEQFDKLVFDEKGWEFTAEQKRWHDLVRKELVEEYNQDKEHINYPITKENYIFPIPASEREINPKLGQNPGY